MIPTVALVGRPNVGKSTLFNKLTKSRDALVADVPGLTRDRRYGRCQLEDQTITLIDTGGLFGEDVLSASLTHQTQLAVAEAETELRSARAWVLESVGEMWDAVATDQEVTRKDRALVLLACSNAVQASIRAVEAVHRAAGASANFTASPLERCLRDVHVVQGHIPVSPQWTQGAGRVLLGLDSGAILL